MTKISIVSIACILFITACDNNESSSTVGTYDKDDTTASAEKSEDASANTNVYVDTSKSIPGSLVKKDTGISLGKKPMKMQLKATKDSSKQ